jgi:hypothetical protein
VRNYAADGSFSISFFMSKAECKDYITNQALYVHRARNEDRRDRDQVASIAIWIGCSDGSDVMKVSLPPLVDPRRLCAVLKILDVMKADMKTPLTGDTIHIGLSDATTRADFTLPLTDAAGGGYLTDEWVHFALGVDANGVSVFLDGRPIPTADFGFRPTDGDPADNAAFPDPTAFTTPMGGYGPLGTGAFGPLLGGTGVAGSRMRANNYEGNIAGLVIFEKQLVADDVACLFAELSQYVAVCGSSGPEGWLEYACSFKSSVRNS